MTNIITTEKTWFIFPQIPLAGYVQAGEGIRSPHEPEMFDNEADWAARCEALGIETEEV